jgi:hypothetical protein
VKRICFFAATRFLASAKGAKINAGIAGIVNITPTGFDVRCWHLTDIQIALPDAE